MSSTEPRCTPVGRAPAAARIDVALRVAVVGGIRIDDAADRAVLVRELGLEPAPAAAVARDDDLALHVDAAPLELLVVIRHAVIDVDELAGDVAVGAVDVVGRQLPVRARGGIAGDRRLAAAAR